MCHLIKLSGRELIFGFVHYCGKLLGTLRLFKMCNSYGKKAQNIFSNDIQHLYNSNNRLTSLKQKDHNMMSLMSEAQSPLEELKMF